MERDYVSELRRTTGILFITYELYEYGEPRWNDIDRKKLLIRPPELSENSTSRNIL
jgi:hypothetical protein